MLRTEFRRICKEGLAFFLILASMVIAILVTDKDPFLAPALELFMLLFASYSGWAVFDRERQDNALEYLLSLPVSRFKILSIKLIPRISITTAVLAGYLILNPVLHLPTLISPADFSLLYVGFFLISFSFSLSLKNYISALFFTAFIFPGQAFLIYMLDETRLRHHILLQAGICAAAMALLFLFKFNRFDIRPAGYFNRRFIPGVLLIIAVSTGAALLTPEKDWGIYYLTSGGTVIRTACNRSDFISSSGRLHSKKCMYPLGETENREILLAHRVIKPGEKCQARSLYVFNESEKSLKKIYDLYPEWELVQWYIGESVIKKTGSCFVMLKSRTTSGHAMLEIKDNLTRIHGIITGFADNTYTIPLMAMENSSDFLILHGTKVFRVNESGPPREVMAAAGIMTWNNRLLGIDKAGVTLMEIGSRNERVLLRRQDPAYKVRRWGSGYRSRFAIYESDGSHVMFDLKTARFKEIKMELKPVNYLEESKQLVAVYLDTGSVRTERLHNGKWLSHTWQSALKGRLVLRVFDSGIILHNRKRYEMYRY